MLNDILKNMNLFVDGLGYAGSVEEVTPPKLTTQMEEFRGGGMDAPVEVDLGMEKLEMDFTVSSMDRELLKLYGLTDTSSRKELSIRGALQDEVTGEVKPLVMNMSGVMKEVDYGSWKPGEKAVLKCMMALRRYQLTIDGEEIHDIDIENSIRVINGVDQLENQREALGI